MHSGYSLVVTQISDARVVVQLNDAQHLQEFRHEIVDINNLIDEIHRWTVVAYRCCGIALRAANALRFAR